MIASERMIFYISKNTVSEEQLKRWGCRAPPLTALQRDELNRSLQMPALGTTPWPVRNPHTDPPAPDRFADEAAIIHSRIEGLENLVMHVLGQHATAETHTWEVGIVIGADLPLHDAIMVFNHMAGGTVSVLVETPTGDLVAVLLCGRESTGAGAGGFLKFLEGVLGQAMQAGEKGGRPLDRSKMN